MNSVVAAYIYGMCLLCGCRVHSANVGHVDEDCCVCVECNDSDEYMLPEDDS